MLFTQWNSSRRFVKLDCMSCEDGEDGTISSQLGQTKLKAHIEDIKSNKKHKLVVRYLGSTQKSCKKSNKQTTNLNKQIS